MEMQKVKNSQNIFGGLSLSDLKTDYKVIGFPW